VSAIAVQQPRAARRDNMVARARQALLFFAVLVFLWSAWEGYRWIGIKTSLTWPFPVNDTTMPHLHGIFAQLFEPSRTNGPLLISVLFDSAVFTGKEALTGFLLGGVIGFALAVLLAHSRLLERGLLPYIVASQTVPILAIAPMVVVWMGSRGTPAWFSVAVIAAYLTFFPVTINSLRGLKSVDPQALELMRSYAGGRWQILWKLRVPTSLPYLFSALRVAAAGSVVGAIVGELPSSIQDGLGGAILNFAQYYSFQPKNLWATNIVAAALGILFFVAVVLVERTVVRRAPEHVA
jgi:NitT/TauT family transport system permease protein